MARILVVDDEDDIRNLVGMWLKGAGHEVIYAANGTDCIETLSKEKVDLVLLDVMMPGPKPKEVLEGVRREAEGTPVIYLTAVEWREETEEQREEGFVPAMESPVEDYILKPTDKEQLLKKVNKVLSGE